MGMALILSIGDPKALPFADLDALNAVKFFIVFIRVEAGENELGVAEPTSFRAFIAFAKGLPTFLLCAGGVGCIDGWGTTEVGGVFFA